MPFVNERIVNDGWKHLADPFDLKAKVRIFQTEADEKKCVPCKHETQAQQRRSVSDFEMTLLGVESTVGFGRQDNLLRIAYVSVEMPNSRLV